MNGFMNIFGGLLKDVGVSLMNFSEIDPAQMINGRHVHSSPKETQVFQSCISFGEDCMSLNLESYIISTMLLVGNC